EIGDHAFDLTPEQGGVDRAAGREVPLQAEVVVLRFGRLQARVAAGGGAVADVGDVLDVDDVGVELGEAGAAQGFAVREAQHQLRSEGVAQHQAGQQLGRTGRGAAVTEHHVGVDVDISQAELTVERLL